MTSTATIPSTDIVFRRDRDGGRALVFVHGFLDDRRIWDPVLAGLSAPGFETVQFDQAGFGDRAGAAGPASLDRFAADLGAVVDAIGKPFVLVGHSMAGLPRDSSRRTESGTPTGASASRPAPRRCSSSISAAAWTTGTRPSPTGWPRTVRSSCSTTPAWPAPAARPRTRSRRRRMTQPRSSARLA